SMPSKQESSGDVYDVVLQDPRDRARAALPEPQTPAREGHLPRLQRLQRGHRYTTNPLFSSEPSGRWAMGNQPIQKTVQVKGSNGAPTSRLRHARTSIALGMRDGLRDASPMVTEPP